MARYTGPKVRLSRRLSTNLFENEKGRRALERRPFPPGAARPHPPSQQRLRVPRPAAGEAEGEVHLRRARAPVQAHLRGGQPPRRARPARTCCACSSCASTTSRSAPAGRRPVRRPASSSTTASSRSTASASTSPATASARATSSRSSPKAAQDDRHPAQHRRPRPLARRLARGRRRRQAGHRPRPARSASTSTSPSASSSSSSSTPSSPPTAPPTRHASQRESHRSHARHAAPHHRSRHRGVGQPSAFRHRTRSSPASATPSATRSAAPCCRRSPARRSRRCASTKRCTSSTRSPASPRTSPTSSSTSRTSSSRPSRPTPVTCRLDARGAGEVTAGDIETTADVEVLNKDLVIAHLSGKGRLAIDLTVEQGRGYSSSDRDTESRTIGVIPIDAIFSPVRRVMFEVEPTRVEQSTNYDRLVLDIETDGSVTPADALASAGATLRSLAELVSSLSEDAPGLELGEVSRRRRRARPTSTCRSRTSTCPSGRATASSGRRSTRSASCCRRPRTTS